MRWVKWRKNGDFPLVSHIGIQLVPISVTLNGCHGKMQEDGSDFELMCLYFVGSCKEINWHFHF